MYKYLQILQKKRFFNKQDVIGITGNVRTAESVLATYQKKGVICRVRRDLYCAANVATGLPDVSKYEVASAINDDSSVAYHAALEFYGLNHQLWNEVRVITSTPFRTFYFDGATFKAQLSNQKAGIVEPILGGGVKVTSLERTVIDCIANSDRAGGYEEVMHCFEALTALYETKLIEMLEVYNKPIIWKKVGCVLEMINDQIELSSSFFETCLKNIDSSVNYLTNPRECKQYVSKWKLYIPKTDSYPYIDELI